MYIHTLQYVGGNTVCTIQYYSSMLCKVHGYKIMYVCTLCPCCTCISAGRRHDKDGLAGLGSSQSPKATTLPKARGPAHFHVNALAVLSLSALIVVFTW